MSGVRGGEPIPHGVLPAADESVVVADRAVPEDAAVLVVGGIGHDDALAAAMARSSPAAHGGRIIEVVGGVDNDAGEVFGEQPGAASLIAYPAVAAWASLRWES